MTEGIWSITQNEQIADGTYLLRLAGDASGIAAGQFVDIRLPEKFLRRPVSVCDWGSDWLSVVYRAVGDGTKILSSLAAGQKLNVLTGLGNGFDLSSAGTAPVLIGGGTGVSPLYGLAKRMAEGGMNPAVLLGFASKKDVFFENEFKALGLKTLVATVDGSCGTAGLVTELMQDIDCTQIYSCGPEAMIKAICGMKKAEGQYSLEARMGCGFGACMGCSIMTASGSKRVCKDGPVFRGGELIW